MPYNVDVMLKKALCNLVMRIVCRHDGDKINTVLARGLLVCHFAEIRIHAAGVRQVIRLSGRAVLIHAAGEAAADQLGGIVRIAPQRWNLPMYEPSPPPIIPNFSINNYSLHFTYQSLRPLPFPRSVMRSLHPRCSRLQSRPCCRTCGRLNAAQMVDPVLQLVIISLRETFCPVVYNLIADLETRTDDWFCGQRQTDCALFHIQFPCRSRSRNSC